MQNEENKQLNTTDELNEQENLENVDMPEDQDTDFEEEPDEEFEEEVLTEKELKKRNKAKLKAAHKKLRSAYALKRGAYTTTITAVFIAGVIIFNVLASALANRFPLQLDLTTDSANSISDENAKYLESVGRDVKITVCSTEEEYTGSYFSSYVKETYKAEDSTGKYFSQTAQLLKQYPKYNNKISVEFADTSTPDFSTTLAKYSNSNSIGIGDILVESTFEVNGKETTRTKTIAFNDIYTTKDDSGYAAYGYGTYTISGSKLETALTSAIYYVTSDKSTKIGIPTMHCDTSTISDLTNTLKDNNYEIAELSTLTLSEIPSDLDGIILAAPSSDFSDSEISVLDSFLENGGKKGKMLLYYPNAVNKELPILEEFLSEWGISYLDGTIYETNTNNIVKENTTIGITNSATDYTASVNNASVIYISGNNAPMQQAYENYENRATKVLMSSSSSTVIKPSGSGTDWKPSGSETKKAYPTAILTADTTYDDDNNQQSSYVVAFSSVDFVSSDWTQYSSVGNLNLTIALMGSTTGRNSTDISFVQKSITNESFSDKVTPAVSNIMIIVFMILIPVVIITLGIVIWVRRKNR